jgi:hypothetical protein
MRKRNHRIADLGKRVRHTFVFASAAILMLTCSANAGTVLQFTQAFPTDFITATDVAGVTTLSTMNNPDGGNMSVPILITNLNGFPEPPPGVLAFETFVGVTSTGPATPVGGSITQTYSGTVEFTAGIGGTGLNYLTATFTNAVLSGSLNSASLNATSPNLILTSAVMPLIADMGMSIGMSGIASPLHIAADGSVASFQAQNAGTYSAIIPEPSGLCLASFAVVIGAFASRANKRMRNELAN